MNALMRYLTKITEAATGMVQFKYVDFNDVPHLVLFTYRGRLILLASYFNEEKDDYDENYSIQILPSWVEQRIAESSWRVLEDDIGAEQIGEISIKDVIFDSSKRNTLDPSFLDKYLECARGQVMQ